jgi:hypothetical protein
MKGHGVNAVLALVFSILIWSAVGAQLSEEKEFTVDFELRLPEDVTVTHEGVMATGQLVIPDVIVTIRGPREEIARLTERDIVPLHDFTRTDEQDTLEEHLARERDTIDLRTSDVSVPPQLEVVSISPDRVELQFSRVEERDIAVIADYVGKPAEGLDVGGIKVSPSEIMVRGPSSVLAQFPGPYRTEPINIDGRRDNLEVTNRRVNTPTGVRASQTVSVEIELVPAPVELQLTFPIHILRATAGDRQVIPSNVGVEPRDREDWTWPLTLRGPPSVLQHLEERLRKEIADPGTQENLPVAFIRAREFLTPQEDAVEGLDDLVEIGVVGLPPGVELASIEKFPIRVRRIE